MNKRLMFRSAIAVATALLLGACSGDNSNSSNQYDDNRAQEIVLIAYDSFTPQDGIFDAFTAETGHTVKVVTGGDSGTVISKAILSAGNPEADVLWGVDNTSLSRVLDADVLDSHAAVNDGDICVNVDDKWFSERNLVPPSSLDDLVEPEYKNLLVVQDPVASSPGLGFLLATIAKFGEDNWQTFWTDLTNNGVLIAPDWTTAYYTNFSGSSGNGDRPLVVSYGSSPPAEVVFSDPPISEPPTSVMEASCFRQTEYAGVLRGTTKADAAEQLLEYLQGVTFQESLPLSLFVFPINPDAQLPEVFQKFAVRPANSLTLNPDTISEKRNEWLEQWREVALS